MTEGLITRIGRWLDRKWETKALESQVEALESRCSERHVGLLGICTELKELIASERLNKDLVDLKKRIEDLELYTNFKRKTDPTKPPLAKSAFSM